MKEFRLTAYCTISITTVVEAETFEEAKKIASQRTDILSAQFEAPEENEHWVAHEYDGMPYNIRLEDD